MKPSTEPIKISSADYFLNIRMIDEQHKKFIDILNSLIILNSGNKEVSFEEIRLILNELEEYLKYHFSTEEKYMTLANFEEIDVHIKEHIQYINKIDEFIQGYKYRNPVLLDEMLAFSKKWFLTHIMQTDAKYTDSLKAYFSEHPGI